jgi:peroxiredoxin
MLNYTIAFLALVGLLAGCKIEESDQGPTGAAYVALNDSVGQPVERAQIYVDNVLTSQRTPSLLQGLNTGAHLITLVRPDIYDVTDTIEVLFHDTTDVPLVAAYRPLGAVELTDAPEGTTLILNTVPSGTTPPNVLFVGIGDHLASLYAPGYATDLPAQWTITVTQGDTARLPAGSSLTALPVGNQPGGLAPTFDLVDDRYPDSSRYRLQDYRGRVILVTFFFVNCAPCLAEMPAIQSVYSDPAFAGRIEFFGIDPNDAYSEFRLFRIAYHPELGLQFPLLYAQNQGVKEAYDVVPFPTNFVIDQTGTIRYRWGGLDETMLREAINTLLAESP